MKAIRLFPLRKLYDKDRAMTKTAFFLFFYCAIYSSFSQSAPGLFLNPTGTYILKGEKHRSEIKGNFAEIRVKLINDSQVAIAMYCNKGYPEYLAGSFTDTLSYADNRAVYASKPDPSCQIIFSFENNGLNIKQVYTDPASTCGFGKGVFPLGFIEKYSSDMPIIQSLSRL
ncbi:MAG: hypothetical protein H7122_20270 [Chitinophagaceae bacterium]|nr:hypothetical protein [Chitinophagaceae bacterium]